MTNDNKPPMTPEQHAAVSRLYAISEHAAKALGLLGGHEISVTVLITGYLQDGEDWRPVTVGSTTSHGSRQAKDHTIGCESVVSDAKKKLAESIDKLEEQEKAAAAAREDDPSDRPD